MNDPIIGLNAWYPVPVLENYAIPVRNLIFYANQRWSLNPLKVESIIFCQKVVIFLQQKKKLEFMSNCMRKWNVIGYNHKINFFMELSWNRLMASLMWEICNPSDPFLFSSSPIYGTEPLFLKTCQIGTWTFPQIPYFVLFYIMDI